MDSVTPSDEELVARAREMVPRLRDRAARCEDDRRVSDETVQELKDAGFYRILQPRAFGGYELDFATYVRVAIELGRGCTSTAWVYENNAMHQLILALFSEQTQRELWATGDSALDDRIASTGWSPVRAKAIPVDGGYILDGRWQFASGSYNCELDLILAPVERDDGGPVPEMRLFLLEHAQGEYEIIDTWHAMGLKGTASNDIVVNEQFVAEHRTMAWSDVNHTPDSGVRPQGSAIHDSVWHRVPVFDWMGWTVTPALIGAARAALEGTASRLTTRTNLMGEKLADTQSVQLRIADASARIDAAESILLEDVAETAQLYGKYEPPSVYKRSVWRRNQAFTARLLMEAMESLLYRGGAHGLATGDPVERAYRDVGAGATHVGTDWDLWGRVHGQALLGMAIAMPNFGFFPEEVVARR